MNMQAALKHQYHAALAMLKQTLEQCPQEEWARADDTVAFWRVAYHTLFFTHLYLQVNAEAFKPWKEHRAEHEYLGPMPWLQNRLPRIGAPYSKEQLLEYWALCDGMVDKAVDTMDLTARECGFPWYKLPKLEHQINNIRHVQHHAALLSGRLRKATGADIRWETMG